MFQNIRYSLGKNTSFMIQGVEVGRKRLSKIDQKMEAKMECILASVLSSILDLKICQNPSNNRLIFFFDGCLDRFFVHFGSTWGGKLGCQIDENVRLACHVWPVWPVWFLTCKGHGEADFAYMGNRVFGQRSIKKLTWFGIDLLWMLVEFGCQTLFNIHQKMIQKLSKINQKSD